MLAWVEYLNRLFGALVGFIILITFVLGYLHFKKSKHVLLSISVLVYLSIFMVLILVDGAPAQGWGGDTAPIELAPVRH